jgi:chorismate mutase/prephenate dehydratase
VTDAAQLETLAECRRRIDEIDRQLVELLNERARVSQQVGRLKAANGSAVFAPAREAEVLEQVQRANSGPLPNAALRSIWIEIMSASSALQRPVRVAYLGPPGTFSHEAALKRFGRSAELVPAPTIPDVFQMRERGEVDYGIVPVENTTDGGVAFALDTFVESPLVACAEVELPIRMNLVSPGTLDTIKRVYCQRVAYAQCRVWLSQHLPKAEVVEVDSTARAVELATAPDVAGIGPEPAAELYGRPILVRNIQDNTNNRTRFLVIGDHVAAPTGRDKTAIVFAVRHRPGALHEALRILAEAGLNLTFIESRPSRQQPWEYVMFVDFQAHQDDPHAARALEQLREQAVFVKVLGSWPEERVFSDPVSAG